MRFTIKNMLSVCAIAFFLFFIVSAKGIGTQVDGPNVVLHGFPFFWHTPGPTSLSRIIDLKYLILDCLFWILFAIIIRIKFNRKLNKKLIATLVIFTIAFLAVFIVFFVLHDVYFGKIDYSSLINYKYSLVI